MTAVERRQEGSIVAELIREDTDRAEIAIDFGPLKQNAGFMLRLAQLQVFERFFAEFGPRGIRPGQIGILVAIAENPGIRQGTLARALRIKRSNMAKIVGLLVRDGLIEKLVPSSDRRAAELRLTRSGRAFVDRALPDVHRNDHSATSMLTERERVMLMRLLHKMTDAALAEAGA
jgi:DNA-binding MarR family transcriptional regulator